MFSTCIKPEKILKINAAKPIDDIKFSIKSVFNVLLLKYKIKTKMPDRITNIFTSRLNLVRLCTLFMLIITFCLIKIHQLTFWKKFFIFLLFRYSHVNVPLRSNRRQKKKINAQTFRHFGRKLINCQKIRKIHNTG